MKLVKWIIFNEKFARVCWNLEPIAALSTPKALVRHESTFVVREMPLPFIKSDSCERCLEKDQRLIRFEEENKKLSAKIRLLTLENVRYEEENQKLKVHLNEYRQNQTILLKKSKETEQIQRLRHELQVYNQVLAAKRREQRKQLEYFYYYRRQ